MVLTAPMANGLLYVEGDEGSLFLRLRGNLHERPVESGGATLKLAASLREEVFSFLL